MAWIKARNTNLFDVTSVHVQDEHSLAVRARTQGYQGTFTLGEYSTHATAETVKDEIAAWLDAGGEGLYKMPSEAELCGEKSQPEHSKRDPKTVQDVKVFPAHDASKPIYGAFTTEPGDIIEVLVGGETLTCKVTKTVRKTPHGTFTTRLGE